MEIPLWFYAVERQDIWLLNQCALFNIIISLYKLFIAHGLYYDYLEQEKKIFAYFKVFTRP